jgi:hypothetical protein
MAALLIGEPERQKIAELIAVAAAGVMSPQRALDAANEDLAGYRDMMGRMLSIELPVGYYVTYSHERQPSDYPEIGVESASIATPKYLRTARLSMSAPVSTRTGPGMSRSPASQRRTVRPLSTPIRRAKPSALRPRALRAERKSEGPKWLNLRTRWS